MVTGRPNTRGRSCAPSSRSATQAASISRQRCGSALGLGENETDRAAGVARDSAHPSYFSIGAEWILTTHSRGCDFKHAVTRFGDYACEPGELVFGGKGTGYGLAISREMQHRARGRDSERAGGQRFAREGRHTSDICGVRRLVIRAAFAHHIGAQGAVRELRAIILEAAVDCCET